MREVQLYRLTLESPECSYWESQAVDPFTIVRIDGSGTITCTAPDGTLVPMEGGLLDGGYLAHQITRWGRGGCPLCGGAWGSIHDDPGACPTYVREARPLGVQEAAKLAGIKPATFRSYVARGQAPSPDYLDDDPGRTGEYPLWRRATLEGWIANRPGQGARNDLK